MPTIRVRPFEYNRVLQIIYLQQIQWMSLAIYNITNVEAIQEDISTRSSIIADYRVAIDKKIKMEREYCLKKRQLISNLKPKFITHPTKPSELFFNSFINVITWEVENVASYVRRLEQQVEPLSLKLLGLDNESKQKLKATRNLGRQYANQNEVLERIKNKFDKKSRELRQCKEEYIVGVLNDMQFDVKNKLNLKIKEIEKDYFPLQRQYEKNVTIINSIAERNAETIHQIVEVISKIENEKIETVKTIFMVLQISGSEYGANMVTENSSTLAKLNELASNNPEFIKQSETDFIKHKEEWLYRKADPCSFINYLFEKMFSSNGSQNLNLNGQADLPSAELDQSFKLLEGYFDEIFFEDKQQNEQAIAELENLMKNSPMARKNFIICLQKLRKIGKFEINQSKMPGIERIFSIFLDQCYEERDTYNSKLLMILSLTYFIRVNEKRIDLQECIKKHPIWNERDWWECALLESIYEKVKIKSKKPEQHAISIWDIKGSGIKHVESEHELTFQYTIFNELMYYITNMRLFQLSENMITLVAKKYLKYFGISHSMANDIETCLVVKQIQFEPENYSPKRCQKKSKLPFSRSE